MKTDVLYKVQKELAKNIELQIRMLMLRQDINQHDLARLMGKGPPAVSMMLSRGTYTLASLIEIATTLGAKIKIEFVEYDPI